MTLGTPSGPTPLHTACVLAPSGGPALWTGLRPAPHSLVRCRNYNAIVGFNTASRSTMGQLLKATRPSPRFHVGNIFIQKMIISLRKVFILSMKMVSSYLSFPRRHGWTAKGEGLNFRPSEVWQTAAGTFAHSTARPSWRSSFVPTGGERRREQSPAPGRTCWRWPSPAGAPRLTDGTRAGPQRSPSPSTSCPGRQGLRSAFTLPTERSTWAVAGRLPHGAAKAGTMLNTGGESRAPHVLREDGPELYALKHRGSLFTGTECNGPARERAPSRARRRNAASLGRRGAPGDS